MSMSFDFQTGGCNSGFLAFPVPNSGRQSSNGLVASNRRCGGVFGLQGGDTEPGTITSKDNINNSKDGKHFWVTEHTL